MKTMLRFAEWLSGSALTCFCVGLLAAGPESAEIAEFVAGKVCAGCHREQSEHWAGSHHAWAMRHADGGSVRGDFNDARFEHFGISSRFFKRDGRFYVTTEGPDSKLHDYEIKYTFGFEPLQQYLIEFPGGRLQALGIAWDTRPREQGGQRWFHLYPDEKLSPGDPLHWTGRYQNWNGMCAECHSTDLEKRYDPQTDRYDTRWSEINIGCQACHGPGSIHVERARETADYDAADSGLMIDFSGNDAAYQVEQCARCHSRRQQVSVDDRHGRPLLDDFLPATLREGLYHADGQILDEVYVYGSFLQSRMYQAGVRCSDCHDPHSTKLKTDGNAVCGQCHNTRPPAGFAGLKAKDYDSPDHHFHPPSSPGSQCVNCHMPAKTYMVVDHRHDHSLRIPRPDLTIKIGTPNACNSCHDDQNVRWAVAKIADWYGPELRQEPHYGETMAAARAGEAGAQQSLLELAGAVTQPAIVRASALETLYPQDRDSLQTLIAAIQDVDALVRTMAVRGLERLPSQYLTEVLTPLLDDPVRAVRLEAARALSTVPRAGISEQQTQAFEQALNKYREVQLASGDVMPGAHLNLAILEANLGHADKAERHYRRALEIDPDFLPARVNLANLYNALQRNAEAEQALREALQRFPEEGELYYSLGLLLAEENRLQEATDALREASRLLPQRARVHYNYALALQHSGQTDKAGAVLRTAHRLDRRDPDILQALIIFHMQRQQWDQAYPYAEQMMQLFPDVPDVRRTLEQIRALQQFGKKPGD